MNTVSSESIANLEQERKEILNAFRGLMRALKDRNKEETKLIRKAFDVALEAHKEMRRKSGEPYIYHPIAVARICAEEMGLGPIAVICENAPVDGYSVYPNPANGLLDIDLELENYQGDDVSIEVIDINGKIIQLQQVQLNRGYNHLEVDLSNIPSGVYMINFVGTRDYIKESRVIKQ